MGTNVLKNTKMFLFFCSIVLLIESIHCHSKKWQQAAHIVSQMDFYTKTLLLHGVHGDYVGNVPAIPKFNIPVMTMEDGPQGVADGTKKTTEWPSALTVTASFSRQNMHAWGEAMAREQREKGTMVMLGPMVNLARVPVDGRAFESTGEDPFLSSILVKPLI